ncbi:hypothetical protein [Nocardioides sp.]|uniref:hypothetical protein n=1 Tax=Nocardioides sp. TaxID=35761 RepID=UPI002721C8AD|nr:hypothetical protein [Nocardioides sp.]MDO9455954.1 hypothetical protein [Nocardioides sp.]
MTWVLRLLLLPVLAAVAVPVLVVTTATPAAACSCELVDPEAPPTWGPEVFVATVVEDLPEDGTGEVEVAAVVTHVYRGDVPDEVTVATEAEGTACGLTSLEAGQTRLFSTSLDGAVARVGSCGGPSVVDDAVIAEAERDLGPGEAREVPEGALEPRGRPGDRLGDGGSGSDGSGAEVLALGLFVGLVVTLAGGVVLVRSRGGAG